MVEEALVCPNCGEELQPGARICGNCFREVRICEACGSVLLRNVVFCQKCGTAVPPIYESSAGGPSHNQPYMVWEGWPYAWLQTITQTRTQWRITLAVIIAAAAVSNLMVVLVFIYTNSDDVCCLSGILIVQVVLCVLILAERYRLGRLGARDLQRKREKERY